MAIDFQQIYERIKEIGLSAQERQETLEKRRVAARALFNAYADNLDGLRKKVDTALVQDANIRCAYPLDENLDTHLPAPATPMDTTLIAADGSQVIPNRQDAELFGLINVGAIVMRLNSGETPEVFTDSHLLYDDELFTDTGSIISEREISLRRDTAERVKLADLAKSYSHPVITFMDGPIALWGTRDPENASSYHENLLKYKKALSELQERDGVIAGYIDKPTANPVVRLLEIMQASSKDLENLRAYHPMLGVSDRWLFGNKEDPLLKAEERSAVFELQSKATKEDYTAAFGVHFFYLNVGTEGHPWPVRIEVPKWVADDKEKLDNLHAVLIQQARILGGKPYPYLLHRSHEIAVVSFSEKRHVQTMLALEFGNNGDEAPKQVAKNSSRK